MADEGIRVSGVDELRRGTRELTGRIEAKANNTLEGTATYRGSMVQAAVPRVKGWLAASVNVAPIENRFDVSIGDDRTPYAGWIEFGGTRGRPYMPEGRYLYPIAMAAQGSVKHEMERATKQTIRGFRWPQPTTIA